MIRSEHGKVLDKFSDPVREGSTLTLICETQGGEPLPRLTWKRGQSVLDDVVEEVLVENELGQIWKQGKPTKEGFFTLENSYSEKLMTAISDISIIVKGKHNIL